MKREAEPKPFISWPDRARELGLQIPEQQQHLTELHYLEHYGLEAYPPRWEDTFPRAQTAFLAWRDEIQEHYRRVHFPNLSTEIPANMDDAARQRRRWIEAVQQRQANRQEVIARVQRLRRERDAGRRQGAGRNRTGQPQDTADQRWRGIRHARPQGNRPAPPNPPLPAPPVATPAIDPEWLQNVSQAFGADGVNQVQRDSLRLIFEQPPPEQPPVSNVVLRPVPPASYDFGERQRLNEEAARRLQHRY